MNKAIHLKAYRIQGIQGNEMISWKDYKKNYTLTAKGP